jgi:heat-inducible transcriptional repressor
MQNDVGLNFRSQDILRSIVRAYIETGEPLGSRTLSKLGSGGSLSPASIRNTMADLADEGYLYQPHTSAGRIPTDKAFQFYVKTLTARPTHNPKIVAELSEAGDVEECVQKTSRMLTEMTRNVGIAAALPATQQQLEHIELISLADRRVLMILVTRDRTVRNRVVVLEEAISPDELTSLRNYVNRNFAGWKLSDARVELMRLLEEERAAYDEVLKHLTVLYQKGLLDLDSNPWIHMEGASNLVGLDLHLTRERMRELFQALEEKKRVLELLDRFLEQSRGELGIQIGLGDVHPSMKELSLIGVTIALPGGSLARIAVLGPLRMNYEKVMSSVLQIGRAFERVQG